MCAVVRHRLSAVVVITLISVPSVAEARHWRHHSYGYYGQDRGADENRDRQLSPRTSDKSATDREKGPSGNRMGFGPAIEQIIRACAQKSLSLRTTPFDRVARVIRLNENQKAALEEVKNAAFESSDALALTCPKNAPASPTKKLDTLVQAINSMATSLTTLRPTMAKFYAVLDEEQKADLAVRSLANEEAKSGRSNRGDSRPAEAVDIEQNSVCHQWAATMRSWPVRQIEARVQLSDVQHAVLYELAGEMYRAAAGLIASCPRDHRFTPLGRIDVEQSQLKALRQGMDRIQPLLTNFERVLNDRQKIGLEAVVNESSRTN